MAPGVQLYRKLQVLPFSSIMVSGLGVTYVGSPKSRRYLPYCTVTVSPGAEITTVRRQKVDWQNDATRWLAAERTGEALAAYDEAGHVHSAATRGQARKADRPLGSRSAGSARRQPRQVGSLEFPVSAAIC